jgi:hypothetical protein
MKKNMTISFLIVQMMIFSACAKVENNLQTTETEFHKKMEGRWVPFKAISNGVITNDEFCASNLFGVYMNAFRITEIEKYSPSTYCGTEFSESGFNGMYNYNATTEEMTFTELFENEKPIILKYILVHFSESKMILKNDVTELHLKKLN